MAGVNSCIHVFHYIHINYFTHTHTLEYLFLAASGTLPQIMSGKKVFVQARRTLTLIYTLGLVGLILRFI
jgi:hypothetical protein